MNFIAFTRNEVAAARARGVRQCVLIGSGPLVRGVFPAAAGKVAENLPMQMFAVAEEQPDDLAATFVPTEFASEPLATALARAGFDKVKATLFLWLGDAGYRTFDAAVTSLSYIASMPAGSGVILNYIAEHPTQGSGTHTALECFASRIRRGGVVVSTIQPEAVNAMLRAIGFHKIVDLRPEELSLSGERLVSAVV